jgi:hypothetical protein
MAMQVRAPRLSYANVTATLALVLALGGTTYAATRVTSQQIANGTIRGVDVKKDSLTGVQINESKLGPIARARSAKTADLLQGLDPTAFERPTRIQMGRAISTQAVAAPILAWPEMGLAIQTDGDADDQADVRVVSTRAAGAAEIKISVLGGAPASNVNLAPGAASVLESVHSTDSLLQFVATDNGGINGPGFALFVTCKANNHGGTQDSQLYCMAIRSSP